MIYGDPESPKRCRKATYWMVARSYFGSFPLRARRRSRAARTFGWWYLNQACELAQTKATRVLVAVVHGVNHLVERGILPPKTIRDQVRTHRVHGWYFLPAGTSVEESIVDLRDLHTVPRPLHDTCPRPGYATQ